MGQRHCWLVLANQTQAGVPREERDHLVVPRGTSMLIDTHAHTPHTSCVHTQTHTMHAHTFIYINDFFLRWGFSV